MSFDTLKFLRDYHINHTSEGSRSRRGWIQIKCPFCQGSSRGWDLGICLDDGRVSCWFCRGKTMLQVIQALTKCSWSEAGRILNQYQGRPTRLYEPVKPLAGHRSFCALPPGCGPMLDRHRGYLLQREFSPDLLEAKFGLQATGIYGPYSFRIILPIMLDGKMVSFQGRDITGRCKDGQKYLACEKSKEVVHHKDILYGLDLARQDSCVVVEGATDVWRLGPGSLATFGTGFKMEQVLLLVRRYKRVFILFDAEDTAQEVAEELAWAVSSQGREALMVDALKPGKDPGGMKQDDANNLMKELGLEGYDHE